MQLNDFVIIFFLQFIAVFIAEYLFSWAKESGKLDALMRKEETDLRKEEKRKIGYQILDFIYKPYETITSNKIIEMYKSSSRLKNNYEELSTKWREYHAKSFILGLDVLSGYAVKNKDMYSENVKQISDLSKYLEKEANRLIGSLK